MSFRLAIFPGCLLALLLIPGASDLHSQEIAPATVSPFELGRRLHFRLLGRAPSRKEMDQFIREADWPALVERLLAHRDFQRTREEFWIQLLAIDTDRDRLWIRDQVEKNTPVHERVRNWFASRRELSETGVDAMKYLETFGPAFLGRGFECSRCHDHPYENTTQLDFLKMAGFFNQSGYTLVPSRYLYNSALPGEPIPAETIFGPTVTVRLSGADRKLILSGEAPDREIHPGDVFGKWISDLPQNPRPFQFLTARYLEWLHGSTSASSRLENLDPDDRMSRAPPEIERVFDLMKTHHFDEIAMIRELSLGLPMAARSGRSRTTRLQWLRSIEAALDRPVEIDESSPGPDSPLVEKTAFLASLLGNIPAEEETNLNDLWLRTLSRFPSRTEQEQITELLREADLPASEVYRALILSDEFQTIP